MAKTAVRVYGISLHDASSTEEKEQPQEVCSGLFVLDKLFALFVLVSQAVLGRGVKALCNAKANSASSPPDDTALLETKFMEKREVGQKK